MEQIDISTIGFTKTSARDFFERLKNARVMRVVDVRLHNTSQLAGFAKADDLAYFLKAIGDIEYMHQPLLAPTDDMLRVYKKEKGAWSEYEREFMKLMTRRQIEKLMEPRLLKGSCLLCSEPQPHYCHRRLVCEYLNGKWNGCLTVSHL